VKAWNSALIEFELAARVKRSSGWRLIMARNRWFQRKVVSALSAHQPLTLDPQPVLFSYSYTAVEPFRFAKARGWKTVLGQIDPGPPEEAIVRRLFEANSGQSGAWQPAPDDYWKDWRQECQLADRIVVNSKWSEQALLQEGVSAEKIRVVPLAYDAPPEAADFERAYPPAFTTKRPLRLLFLGQVNLRKGLIPILDAVRQLKDEPIEWWFVGPVQMNVPANFLNHERIRWFGFVPRGKAARFYRDADLFLFPTFSDGFGLTQLEAQAWRLPIVASRFCGDVVQDGVNGLLLPEVSADAITKVLRDLVGNPGRLRDFSGKSGVNGRFGLKALATSLLSL
jgi:glycosyltransferase involved in cell wall biosynthesis